MNEKKNLGFGLGLRTEHHDVVLKDHPPVDWFEIITENYLISGGKALYDLDRIREQYPLVMHGVSMSLGSVDPLDQHYLKQLQSLANRIQPQWISDHLCWTGVHGRNTHDLLPLPYTEETIQHVVDRIQRVQDFLGRQILIENVSSYVNYTCSNMTEWDFISEIALRSDSLILLDVNNVYVSSVNHHFDPLEYIHAMPRERVVQIHLAGHSNQGDHIIDTHDQPISDSVWECYGAALRHIGSVSTMIERDNHIPPFSELLTELSHAKRMAQHLFCEAFVDDTE